MSDAGRPPLLRLYVLSIASALFACNTFDSTTTDGGDGIDNESDAETRDADTDDANPLNPRMDSSIDSRHDAGNGQQEAARWIATKTTLDVWWQGVPVRDPGRGEMELYTLTKTHGSCADGADDTTVKLCGLTFPPSTSDVTCNAYEMSIPGSAWDKPGAPSFALRAAGNVDADGLRSAVATALVGIELTQDEGDSAWPEHAGDVACNEGTGLSCFPDHDDDTLPGVSAQVRNDLATYVGPLDDGLCWNDMAYRYRGIATGIDLGAGGGAGGGILANGIQLGLRVTLASTIGADTCLDPASAPIATAVELRAVGCTVDPRTLFSHPSYGDPRLATMDFACNAYEAQFVDQEMPQYRVLATGEQPGDSMRPLGWERISRDIDKTPSEGTHSVSVEIHVDDTDAGGHGEPSCAQVRATFAND